MLPEAIIFQRRNRLKRHFVNTSNVLLYGYKLLSAEAKITYQVIDSFDWEDKETGESKGYVYPAIETLAEIRNTSTRTIHRHIKELEKVKLLTRQRRSHKASYLIIEDVSKEEIKNYLDRYVTKAQKQEQTKRGGGEGNGVMTKVSIDKNVTLLKGSQLTKMSLDNTKEDELKENKINVNEDFKTLQRENRKEQTKKSNRGGTKSLRDLLMQYDLQIPRKIKNEATVQRKTSKVNGGIDKNQRDYLASEIAEKLNDHKSLGAFRVIAERVPQSVVFEVLSSIKETAREGKIKVSRGALFIDIIKGYCGSHDIDLGFSTNHAN